MDDVPEGFRWEPREANPTGAEGVSSCREEEEEEGGGPQDKLSSSRIT